MSKLRALMIIIAYTGFAFSLRRVIQGDKKYLVIMALMVIAMGLLGWYKINS